MLRSRSTHFARAYSDSLATSKFLNKLYGYNNMSIKVPRLGCKRLLPLYCVDYCKFSLPSPVFNPENQSWLILWSIAKVVTQTPPYLATICSSVYNCYRNTEQYGLYTHIHYLCHVINFNQWQCVRLPTKPTKQMHSAMPLVDFINKLVTWRQ